MNFRQFISLSEQGTQFSATGANAGGRAGQSQATPEGPVLNPPSPNANPMQNIKQGPKVIPASSFNTSSKGVAKNVPPGFMAGGIKPVNSPSPSPLSPAGWSMGKLQQVNPNGQSQAQQTQTKVPTNNSLK